MQHKLPEQLIVRYLSNEANEKEQNALLDWIKEHPDHQTLFNEYADAWRFNCRASENFDLEKARARINKKIHAKEHTERVSFLRRVAAVLFFVIGSTALFILAFYPFSEEEITMTTVSTLPGERKTVTLADGSVVRLNAGATLSYPQAFNDTVRKVSISGEAFFTVTRDQRKPFIVESGKIKTRVLGTSFNIVSYGDSASVTVATGKVHVSSSAESAFLSPSEKVTYNNSSLSKSACSLQDELAWMDNRIVFRNTSMTNAIATLERWYGVTIYGGESFRRCTINGTFENKSLTHILETLRFTTGITSRVNGKEIWLEGSSCQ
jgi:transmembrane sensor